MSSENCFFLLAVTRNAGGATICINHLHLMCIEEYGDRKWWRHFSVGIYNIEEQKSSAVLLSNTNRNQKRSTIFWGVLSFIFWHFWLLTCHHHHHRLWHIILRITSSLGQIYNMHVYNICVCLCRRSRPVMGNVNRKNICVRCAVWWSTWTALPTQHTIICQSEYNRIQPTSTTDFWLVHFCVTLHTGKYFFSLSVWNIFLGGYIYDMGAGISILYIFFRVWNQFDSSGVYIYKCSYPGEYNKLGWVFF